MRDTTPAFSTRISEENPNKSNLAREPLQIIIMRLFNEYVTLLFFPHCKFLHKMRMREVGEKLSA